jgi:hypothetical protein
MFDWVKKKMIQAQLSKLPAEQRLMIEKILDTDPELLEKMMTEVQNEIKKGSNQMAAMMTVGRKYQSDLKRVMGVK